MSNMSFSQQISPSNINSVNHPYMNLDFNSQINTKSLMKLNQSQKSIVKIN